MVARSLRCATRTPRQVRASKSEAFDPRLQRAVVAEPETRDAELIRWEFAGFHVSGVHFG